MQGGENDGWTVDSGHLLMTWRRLSLFALGLALAACSAQTGAAEPYKLELDDLIARSEGVEPAASILKDRVITEAEIAEVDKAFISCVENAGFPGAIVEDLAGHVGIPMPADGSDSSAAFSECSESTFFSGIHGVFWGMRTNPKNLSQGEATLECLKRFQLIDPGLTADEFMREEEEWIASAPRVDGVIHGDPGQAHSYSDQAEGERMHTECMIDPSIVPNSE